MEGLSASVSTITVIYSKNERSRNMPGIFGLIWIYVLWKVVNGVIIGCSTPTSLITHERIDEMARNNQIRRDRRND